ncbi:flavin reductase family protein [Streptomyces sp. NPDC007157]|uniref:flavin reductase family protein n=1 Tax=Streptomyces sp. NPDC007157 TaxID=3154681 RepID=UPI0034031B11
MGVTAFQEFLGSVTPGVAVVTAASRGGEPQDFLPNALSTVCADPPLLSMCLLGRTERVGVGPRRPLLDPRGVFDASDSAVEPAARA